MKRFSFSRIIPTLFVAFISFSIQAQNDGPYIFIEKTQLIEKTIKNGKVITKSIPLNTYKTEYATEVSEYKNVKKIAALSDIHGQYDLFIKLLKNNKIINNELKWNYGKGHLVVVGDVFDRGKKVTEVLWFLYNLEKQANQKGGKVHFLLGNHEYMVLFKDLRYIHPKYKTTSKLLGVTYDQLFNKNTVLGKWLRSKSTLVKINNDTYVHGGISREFLSLGYEINHVNNLMRKAIDKKKSELNTTSFYKNYFGTNGPIWYRGYFYEKLQKQEIVGILKDINSEHIIVGHCSNKEVVQLFDKRVFGVDSSIKWGLYGELLMIEKKSYKRATLEGKKISF